MLFRNVFKKINKENEPLKYEKINENITLNDDLVDSLMRSKRAKIRISDEEGYDIYYNF